MFTRAPTLPLPPGPKRSYPLAHLFAMRRDPLAFLTKLARDHGDIAHFRLGSMKMFFINSPELVREVLVVRHQSFKKGYALQRSKRLLGEGLLTSEGEFHMRQRRLSQPAFQPQRIAAYGETMSAEAGELSARWKDGETVEIADAMKHLALIIAGKVFFGAEMAGDAQEINQALTSALQLFDSFTIPFSEYLEKLPLPSVFRFKRAKARLDAAIYKMIALRRASTEERDDLLSRLLKARDTEGASGGMTDLQLRDEMMTIFLAGHETTANAMTWTWYLLSQNPEARAKMEAELDRVLDGRAPTAADLDALDYTTRVFAESMRLYPPAWAIGRRVLQDFTVGPPLLDRSYTIPAGAIVLMSQWVMHRDPRYYSDPERFDPDRFLPEAKAARPKFAYFPFGGGPRVCIGEAFAWMEGVLLLATLAQKWRMRLAPDQKVVPQPLVTLRAKFGLKMVMERRK